MLSKKDIIKKGGFIMETLNKKAIVELVAEKTGVTKKAAGETLEVVLEAITEALKSGSKVDLSGFGKFEVKVRNARTGINPATKETIEIPETKVPSFKAAKALKEAVK